MRMFNQKQICLMSQETNPSAEVVRRQQEREFDISQTVLFESNAPAIFRSYEKWKDIPQCYFIKLRLNLGYYNTAGLAMWMANPPYWLGTIVRNSIEHPELFGAKCPCGHQAYAYRYAGSPLSGSFSLNVACPECGWKGRSSRSGWMIRRDTLQESQSKDRRFLGLLKQNGIDFKVADIRDLLRYIGVPETVIANPEPAEKIERFEGPNGEVTLIDPYGGAIIFTGSAIHSRRWDGPSDLVTREIELMNQRKNGDGTCK